MNALENSRDFFQTLAHTPLEEQKDFVYQSLKSQTADELLSTPTTYSDKERLVALKEKVQAFANERNQEITKLAKEFSAFFDRKETLLSSHPSFSAKQRIIKAISLEYISKDDQALVEKIQGIGKYAFRKWEGFFKVNSTPAVAGTDSLASLFKEWGDSFARLQAEKNQEKMDGLTPQQEEIERNKQLEEAVSSLLESLTEFERIKRELQEDEEYFKFKLQKGTLKRTFIGVSSFCEVKELSNHEKMTNESKALIRKWAKLSSMNAFEYSKDFFQTLANTPLEEQKELVYQHLKFQTAYELLETQTTYSDDEQLVILKSKVRAFADERTQEITQLVSGFQAFLERKKTFSELNFLNNQNEDDYLTYLRKDDQALVEKIRGIGEYAFKKWQRFFKTFSIKDRRLLSSFNNWAVAFEYAQAQKNKEAQGLTPSSNLSFFREGLKEKLLSAILKEDLMVVEDRCLKAYEKLSEETLSAFHELLSEIKDFLATNQEFRLKQKQKEIKRNKKREEAASHLLKFLAEYEKVKQKLNAKEEYMEFKLQKKKLKQELPRVLSFCRLKELTNHEKMRSKFTTLVYKWTKLS